MQSAEEPCGGDIDPTFTVGIGTINSESYLLDAAGVDRVFLRRNIDCRWRIKKRVNCTLSLTISKLAVDEQWPNCNALSIQTVGCLSDSGGGVPLHCREKLYSRRDVGKGIGFPRQSQDSGWCARERLLF